MAKFALIDLDPDLDLHEEELDEEDSQDED
jgi:hypothetical protein